MLQAIDARAARQWVVAALVALGEAREELDALNVFPVPDGDTGTNLYLTVEAAVAAVAALPPTAEVSEVLDAFAHGALMGARGNSGIIAAQLMRGWADVLAERRVLDAAALAEAVRRADQQAWLAVATPVEGTILSVSRAAARAASEVCDGGLPDVVTAQRPGRPSRPPVSSSSRCVAPGSWTPAAAATWWSSRRSRTWCTGATPGRGPDGAASSRCPPRT